MAFWKKSEDPWDIDPKKRRAAPAVCEQDGQEPENDAPGLLDSLKSWVKDLGDGKDSPAKAEDATPPEKCPSCGGEMENGYLYGSRGIYWIPGSPSWKTYLVGVGSAATRIDVDGGFFSAHKTCRYCATCRRLAVDVPEPAGPNYVWEGGKVKLPGVEEDETQE